MKAVSLMLCSLLFLQSVAAREYVIGVEDLEYSPIYVTRHGNYEGYARDLLDSFARSAGYTFSYRPLPVKRLFADFLSGKLDFKYPDNPHWEVPGRNEKTLYYSAVTLVAIDGVMVPAAREPGRTLTRLVTIRGFTPRVFMDAINRGQIVLQEVNDLNAAVSSVLVGRAEGLYGNIAVVRQHLQENGLSGQLIFDRALPHANSDFRLATQAHPQLIEEFNAFLRDQAELVSGLKKRHGVDID